jgi:hypothetical protein
MASNSPNGQLDVVATSAQLRATDVGVTVMAVVFVILRFTARWRRKVPIGLDDHLIVVSMVRDQGHFIYSGRTDMTMMAVFPLR